MIMRKLLFFLAFLYVNVLFSFAQATNVGREQAWTIVRHKLLNDNVNDVEVSCYEKVIPAKSKIKTIISDVDTPSFDSWFFFIDDKPFANWEHPCRYAFVNINDGDVEFVEKKMPPMLSMERIVTHTPKESNIALQDLAKIVEAKSSQTTTVSANNDYAVIISGGLNKEYNYERYWNDCSLIYRTLVNVYKYPKKHIYVLMADGTDSSDDQRVNSNTYRSSPLDLDGDGISDVNYSATHANIAKVFDELSSVLTLNDNLFVFSTDHGGVLPGTNNVYMCLWNNTYITDEEFAKEIDKVHSKSINICMEQCYSGGFIDDLQGMNRVVSTACAYDEISYSTENYLYDEFVYLWITAVAGTSSNGTLVDCDINGDGLVSMYEAFKYAQEHDSRRETPQYYSGTEGLGEHTFLSQSVFGILGDVIVCDTAIYSVVNLPNTASVKWEIDTKKGGCIYKHNTPGKNDFYIQKVGGVPFNGILTAKIYFGDGLLASVEKQVSAKDVFSGTYEQESGLVNNVYHPAMPKSSLKGGVAMFVHQGCNVILKSQSGFELMDISHSGATPSKWYFNGKDQITFVLPVESGGVPFHVVGKGKGGSCGDFDLLFFSVSNNANVSSLNVDFWGKYCRVSVDTFKSNDIQESIDCHLEGTWKLELYDLMVGNKLFEVYANDDYYDIDLSSFNRGVYIVRVVKENIVLSKKIVIE